MCIRKNYLNLDIETKSFLVFSIRSVIISISRYNAAMALIISSMLILPDRIPSRKACTRAVNPSHITLQIFYLVFYFNHVHSHHLPKKLQISLYFLQLLLHFKATHAPKAVFGERKSFSGSSSGLCSPRMLKCGYPLTDNRA